MAPDVDPVHPSFLSSMSSVGRPVVNSKVTYLYGHRSTHPTNLALE